RAPADLLHLGVGLAQQVVTVEQDLAADDAGGRARDEADDAQARHALAGARLADQPQRLRLAQGEGYPVHRLDRAPAGDDVGLEVANVDDGGGHRDRGQSCRSFGSSGARRPPPRRLNAWTTMQIWTPA